MKQLLIYLLVLLVLPCCKHNEEAEETEPAEGATPVTVTTVSHEPMQEFITLNATSAYLQKWPVKANATGYLQAGNLQLNQYVNIGQQLYTIQTKEAKSIGNAINVLDSTFRFTGINHIKANGAGFISQLDHQGGDYVQDGEQLALITDTRSFVFLLDMPYELRPYILNKTSLQMELPDGEVLAGMISGNMPAMDIGSQTQHIILKVKSTHQLPENLIAKVKLVKTSKAMANSLPKAAILSDETQAEFWVMKMTDSATAAKVIIEKGIETNDMVEILSPVFSANDKILLTGNYGLSDTAKVKIVQ
ncbi:MAG: RND transporter [Ferruginibacter sp.]